MLLQAKATTLMQVAYIGVLFSGGSLAEVPHLIARVQLRHTNSPNTAVNSLLL